VTGERGPDAGPGPDSGAPGPGEEIELRIDALAAGGDGVGRAPDGRVVFVPLTAPGDRVRARVVRARPRFAHAEPEALVETGERVEPRCPVFGRCGGCAWQHLPYATQCEAKGRIVEDALRRIAHLEPPAPVAVVPSPQAYGYRSRARVVCGPDGVGYRRRRSHEIVATAECPILAAPVAQRLAALAARPPERPGEWDLAEGVDGGRSHPRRAPAPPLSLAVGEDVLRISAGVFFQANAGLHAALVRAVAEAAGTGERAVELHAGAGFFTLALARAFARVDAVEASRPAVADLRHNLARARAAGRAPAKVRVWGERVEKALARAALREPPPAALVLDPPRTGLGAREREQVAELGAARIVYLSCDPATLARDLGALAAAGYALDAVRAFDLFPQTPHVEVLAALRRAPEPSVVAGPVEA